MTHELKSGSVLVRTNAELPESLNLEGDMIVPGWTALSCTTAASVERAIAQAGWHWFWVVPSMTATAYARDCQGVLKRVLKKALQEAESQGLNAIEITELVVRKFWFIHRAKMAVNFRHIGETPVLFEKPKSNGNSAPSSMAASAA